MDDVIHIELLVILLGGLVDEGLKLFVVVDVHVDEELFDNGLQDTVEVAQVFLEP